MKPLFTVHEGEFLVGAYINRHFKKKFEVWVPTKDEGVDLLVTRRRGKQRPVRVQVKFSRSYGFKGVAPERFLARGWFTLKPKKIRSSKADLWVFVILTLQQQAVYILVPTKELVKRIPKLPGKMWNLYPTAFKPRRCYDLRGLTKSESHLAVVDGPRDKKRDYSCFLENWKLLDEMSE